MYLLLHDIYLLLLIGELLSFSSLDDLLWHLPIHWYTHSSLPYSTLLLVDLISSWIIYILFRLSFPRLYIAPEILYQTPYAEEVDMWSVGVVTYAL